MMVYDLGLELCLGLGLCVFLRVFLNCECDELVCFKVSIYFCFFCVLYRGRCEPGCQ